VLRRLEEEFATARLSVIPAGGRDKVLQVFRRREEVQGVTLIFIADRDMWVYGDIPSEYDASSLIFTRGYSIENDVFIDGELESFLTRDERAAFESELERFIIWYALSVSRILKGISSSITQYPGMILGSDGKAADLKENEEYPEEFRRCISADYKRLVRGKSLLALLTRQLAHKGRRPQLSHRHLLELVAVRKGSCLKDLYDRVEKVLHE
jgi:hypothetical protein